MGGLWGGGDRSHGAACAVGAPQAAQHARGPCTTAHATHQPQRKHEHEQAVANVAKHDGKQEGEGDDGEEGGVGLTVPCDACGAARDTA